MGQILFPILFGILLLGLISIPSVYAIDSDGDGLDDSVEVLGFTDPNDDDTDDDGLLDGTEDANGNGFYDIGETDGTNFDTDGDGLGDGLEVGLTTPQGSDTDLGIFTPDTDPATTTDPLDIDTDDDFWPDGTEDFNLNGRVDQGEPDPNVADIDVDGDGYLSDSFMDGLDCDDSDPNVNPSIQEIVNNVDDDCNGLVDDGLDDDGDGYFGTIYGGDDCDDSNPYTNPGAEESIADGIDNNCDGVESCYVDSDGDSYGTFPIVDSFSLSCNNPGMSDNDFDCDDISDTVYPGAPEVIGDGVDQDCNGEDALPDSDGDGIPDIDDPCPFDAENSCVSCDADEDNIITSAELLAYFEAFGITEEDLPFPIEQTILLLESQTPGSNQNGVIDTIGELQALNFGLNDFGFPTCDSVFDPIDDDGDGFTLADGDCDDSDPNIHPGAYDVPNNGIDEDCDGVDAEIPADDILAAIADAKSMILAAIADAKSMILGSLGTLQSDVSEIKADVNEIAVTKTVTETIQLDKFVFKSGELAVLLDVTNSGTLANVHVAANLPCDGTNTPELSIVAGEAGGILAPVISTSAEFTGFSGPAGTCVYHGDVDTSDVTLITDVIITDNGLSRAVADNVIVTITGTFE